MRFTAKRPSYFVKRRLANELVYRPKRRTTALEAPGHLSQKQVKELGVIAGTYLPDLHDPAAVEVLLVLLEVCHILQLSDYRLGKVFGNRLHDLETWGDIVPPKRRPAQLQRAWVWVPNTWQPQLYPIAADGTVCIYSKEQDDQSNKEQE